jgi:tRNA-specific 2-thiouridylase
MKKILLGISGGVDSRVSAYILKQSGRDVVAVTMKLTENENAGKCAGLANVAAARELCKTLNIPHYILDYTKEFKQYVINNFTENYARGKTPNPCVECNRYLKFGVLADFATRMGCEKIATGHYAKTEYSEKYPSVVLKKRRRNKKDQSYFLYNIKREILPRLVFPLANFHSKDQVRNFAKMKNIPSAQRPDSEDICFIPDGDYKSFLKNQGFWENPGDIIHKDGTVLGRHKGLYCYTTGQRKGLGIGYKNPLYVVDFDKEKNRLIVGEEKYLYRSEFFIENVNWLAGNFPTEKITAKVKTRYTQKEYDATLQPLGNNRGLVQLAENQKQITRGQSAVFYDGDIVLGGGKIALNT